MDDAKQQLVDKLKTANNILVTVSRDPSVDQLASCLGLALALNKQGKHTAAVFSGQVPSTLEFLQPENTLEKNTDSLRDFIIALDKSKADKLRYKVEDNVVRIFITPYKTSISEADLDFSQGDFNVDLVVALGVGKQEDLDDAIMAHGRILHDATVASINIVADGGLGSINWQNTQASSLSELVTDLVRSLDPSLLDGQIATALLTGIVSATDRFSNDKTSSQTMSASATLMTAGANQQLVASKLEEPGQAAPAAAPVENDQDGTDEGDEEDTRPDQDGTIEIEHDGNKPADQAESETAIELPVPTEENNPVSDDPPTADANDTLPAEAASNLSPGPALVTDQPVLGGTLTANSRPLALDPSTDPFSLPKAEPPQLLDHKPEPPAALTPPPADWTPPADSSSISLSDLEDKVKKEEAQATGDVANEATGLNTARDEVSRALNTAESTIPPRPIEALNAQPLGDNLHVDTPTPAATGPSDSSSGDSNLSQILAAPPTTPADTTPPPAPLADPTSSADPQVTDPNAPPPVPPPIPFQFGNPNPPQQ